MNRIRGALLGLAIGDAVGWPAARHRSVGLPAWTRRLGRELEEFAESEHQTTLPVSFALNQPTAPLRLGPSDDAEWAGFAAAAVLASPADPEAGVDAAWTRLAQQEVRGRISVLTALQNLAGGARPPQSGHDNPHYFDDAACARAVALAARYPGDPDRAARLAEHDAVYTQDGDGVHGARAIAAAIAAALGGAGVDAAVRRGMRELPDGSEIARNAQRAVAIVGDDPFAAVPMLEELIDRVYSYSVAAAETVPIAFALSLAAAGQLTLAVPAAACLSRIADSAPALTGAITGAVGSAIPDAWTATARTLAGCALPQFSGVDLIDLADALSTCEERNVSA